MKRQDLLGITQFIKLNEFNQFLQLGFGSCHSFGVALGLRGYGMCQMRGQFVVESF
jgi:hypothetical protein